MAVNIPLPPHQIEDDPFEALATNQALRLRLDSWKKEEEVVNQRIERKEQRLQNTKNEIYQLLGLYFVFQGVILTALAQASNVPKKKLWIPLTLSLLASLATILALWYKLGDSYELEKQIRGEKLHAKALYHACDRLKCMGNQFDPKDWNLQPKLSDTAEEQHRGSWFARIWESHMGAYGFSLIMILLIFSGIMAASCYLIHSPDPECKCPNNNNS